MMQEVAIIGAGPAGIACAVQLARYGYKPLLFEKDIPGGLLKNANLVENYPGFPGGISGSSLVAKLAKHLELAGVPLIRETVSQVTYLNNKYRIETDQKEYSCSILVVASGTSPLPIHNRQSTIDNRISSRIFSEIHPIRHVRNTRIAIIGAGDAAFDYALNLARYNKVCIFNRSATVKCLPLLWHRAKGVGQVSYFENHSLLEAQFDQSSSCLKLFFETEGKIGSHLADYIIFAIGRRPELSYADPGLISLFEQLQQQSKLYLVGDVKNDLFRQASIAAGDGIRAAMQIYFNESNKKDHR
jgi:thioredoxin reductase (NADPH)